MYPTVSKPEMLSPLSNLVIAGTVTFLRDFSHCDSPTERPSATRSEGGPMEGQFPALGSASIERVEQRQCIYT